MADPICRWRNPKLSTVIELISLLPKEEMTKNKAREIVVENSPYKAEFYTTPYQLACQLGLYYETKERYFPKFTFEPTEEDVINYLQNWIVHYTVPNPYTKKMGDVEPFSIHSAFCERLFAAKNSLSFEDLLLEIFEEEIGNDDILKNSISYYSPVITIANGSVQLKEKTNYDDLIPFIKVDINIERDNKEYFFDLFTLPIKPTINPLYQDLIQEATKEDFALINSIQEIPNLTQTQKNQIVAARIGQGFFRRTLLDECNYCPITTIDDSRLLVASHIKPWRNSNNHERLNPKNGILLTPTFDKLFDKGYISFNSDKTLIISNKISEENIQKLGLIQNMQIPLLPINGREDFLEYHRNQILQP